MKSNIDVKQIKTKLKTYIYLIKTITYFLSEISPICDAIYKWIVKLLNKQQIFFFSLAHFKRTEK